MVNSHNDRLWNVARDRVSASKAPAASIRCEFQDCRNSTPAISQRKRTDQTLDLHSDSLVCREIPVILVQAKHGCPKTKEYFDEALFRPWRLFVVAAYHLARGRL